MNAMNRRAFARVAMAVPAASWLLPSFSQTGAGVGKLLVGYPAGGTLDTTARQLAEAWRKQGRLYIVDNRAGAAGRIANSQLKRERPDGGTLLCTHASALTIYPHVYSRLMYDPATDLQPVSPLVAATCAFAVSNAAPPSVLDVQTYVDWVAPCTRLRQLCLPGRRLICAFPRVSAFRRGGIEASARRIPRVRPCHAGLDRRTDPGVLRVRRGLPALPEAGEDQNPGSLRREAHTVPAQGGDLCRAGLLEVRGVETYGIFAPPGAPESTIQALHTSMVAASKDPALRAAFEQVGLEPLTLTPGEYAKQLQREREFWAPIVRASGFRSEE